MLPPKTTILIFVLVVLLVIWQLVLLPFLLHHVVQMAWVIEPTPLVERQGCLRVIVGIDSPQEKRRENWRILLRMPVDENAPLNCGLNFVFWNSKTAAHWFHYALANYPQADFIARMESDTSINKRWLEQEFAEALSQRADYLGRPACAEQECTLNKNCEGFCALSMRFARDLDAVHKKHGAMARPNHDIGRSIGELIQLAGLQRGCCQSHSIQQARPVQQCKYKCYALYAVGDEQVLHILQSGNNRTISTSSPQKMNQILHHPSPAISFQTNQGDDASTKFLAEVPYKVWAFWFGPPMEGARLRGFEKLKQTIGAPLVLVQEKDLHRYNLTFSPMHPLIGSGALSAVHTADYLRVYFMHHYGGGYHDIKPHSQSWASSFNVLKDEHIWMYGIPEPNRRAVGCDDSNVLNCIQNRSMEGMHNLQGSQGPCCGAVKSQWRKLASNGAYIMRPGTLLTAMWLDLVESHMTAKMEQALKHPAPYARCCWRPKPPYPFRWIELHGEALHPAQFMYLDHIKLGLSKWDIGNYRGNAEDRIKRKLALETMGQ